MRLYSTFLLLLVSILGFSQEKNVFDVARKGTLTEIQEIYKANPQQINALNESQSSPLILAAYRNNEAVALYLAEKVKDINYNSGQGTALMAAVMSGNLKIIEKIIALKADLNQKDASGKTALIYAVSFDKNDIVKALLKAGADKTIKGKDGKSALDFAVFNKNTQLMILLDQSSK